MFDRVKGLHSLDLPADAIFELLVSNNDNMVAIDPYTLQEAVATIIFAKSEGVVKCYVHFAMMENSAGVVFRWNGPVTKANYEEIMNSARDFVESMGFLMDDKEYRKLAPAKQAQLYESSLAFGSKQGESGSRSVILLDDSKQDSAIEIEAEAVVAEETDTQLDDKASESIVFL